MKKSGSIVKTIIVGIIMIGLIAGFYFAISSRNNGTGKETTKSKNEDTLLRRDLERDYPLTPTAVVSYYSDLVLAYYKDGCKEATREDLIVKSRLLYDDELLENNPEDEQLLNMEAEIKDYKKNKKQIIKYTVCKPEEVQYGDLDGADVALVQVAYRIREKKDLNEVKEEFFLRKDEGGHWKIVGWQRNYKKET